MLRNILIVLAIIAYCLLANLLLHSKPGGDARVGYYYAFLVYGAAFVISTGFLAWSMNVNHCFDWLPTSFLRYRNWVVFVGWLAFVMTTFWSLEYHTKWIEGEFPQFMRWLALSKVYFWVPLLVFGTCLYLINGQRGTDFPPTWLKGAFTVSFSVSLLIGLVVFGKFGMLWIQKRIDVFQVKSAWKAGQQADYQKALDYINNYQDSTIAGLLKYVESGNDEQLRNNALAKIKTYPKNEEDLIAILTQKDLEKVYIYDDNTYYVYAYLDGNKVEHPEKFIQPIIYSLNVLSIRAEKDINDPFSRELGLLNIETVCRVLETQFKAYAKEFKPSMLKLQKALTTEAPERKYEPVRKRYVKTLNKFRSAVNNWLAANSK
ncbi:MAG: hypothetical protein R3B93_28115 [Bacteroidia bacterium]